MAGTRLSTGPRPCRFTNRGHNLKEHAVEAVSKLCTGCQIEKLSTEFHRNRRAADGLYSRCRSCASEYNKAYRLANADKLAARKRAYVAENRDRVAAYNRGYRVANPELFHVAQQRRRARKAGIDYDPAVTIESLRQRDGEQCSYCSFWMAFDGDPNAPLYRNLEHVVPLSRGGAHTFDNTVLACRACNMSKGSKLFLAEWVGRTA